MMELLERLGRDRIVEKDDLASLIETADPALHARAADMARDISRRRFGDAIYIRGLIEFTNYCKNDCHYCGIRRGNRNVSRYRLGMEDILASCRLGHRLGFRTFVLQGGEDECFNDDALVGLVAAIRSAFPDCALTLSVGERSHASYRRLHVAGVDRYLLRHETADPAHYALLHPASLSLENRKRCLWDLKRIGFQTGCGFMVGSPHQTAENLADDLLFICQLQPEMVGIGPFIPHHDTPFAHFPPGSVERTLFMISLVRILQPNVLLPATTALGTMDPEGREKAILAGANVVMPNLSPPDVREKYMLYDNKLHTGVEAAEHLDSLRRRLAAIGYRVVVDRGDYARTF